MSVGCDHGRKLLWLSIYSSISSFIFLNSFFIDKIRNARTICCVADIFGDETESIISNYLKSLDNKSKKNDKAGKASLSRQK